MGGRYGSTDENGIRFTEREYDLAVSKQVPILAFLHAEPGKLPAENCEMDEAARTKLDSFREKVERHHHCNFWRNSDDLAMKVVVSLVNEIAQNPRSGWVRGDLADDQQELLAVVEGVRRENDTLRAQMNEIKSSNFYIDGGESISQGNDSVTLKLHRRVELDKSSKVETDEVTASWHDLFMTIAWDATSGATHATLMRTIAKKFGDRYYMDDETWKRIATQFLALDLLAVRQEMRPNSSLHHIFGRSLRGEEGPKEEPTDIWYLTERGRRLFAQASALKRATADS